MPLKGRPAVSNPFANVTMNSGQPKKNARREASVGNQLNKIAGKQQMGSRFVDGKEHNKMGKDGFLKLLSHQLQNQDPLKPMDQKQFAADLAQFAQLEQMTNMNKKLDEQTAGVPTENKFYGASFLGKEIITKGTSLKLDEEYDTAEIPFHRPNHAQKVMIRFYDKKNQLVAQLDQDNLGMGTHTLKWDGVGYNGYHVGKGEYRAEVRAWDEQLQEFQGETKSKGLITGVSFDSGETVFTLKGGKKVFLRDVDSFSMKREASKQNNSQVNNAASTKLPALQKKAVDTYNNIDENTL